MPYSKSIKAVDRRATVSTPKGKLHVFVSSVQQELEDERLIVQNLIQTDPFLQKYCEPKLYEFEPASAADALEECLGLVSKCQIYVLMIWKEYGNPTNGLSITHREYRRAKENGIPILAFIRGPANLKREDGTESLLAELKDDNFKRKRFGNVIELQKEVRSALVKLLGERFGVMPTSDEDEIAENTIEATSTFESQLLRHVPLAELDISVGRALIEAAKDGNEAEVLVDNEILTSLALRGLIRHDAEQQEYYATAAGAVLLGKDPSAPFPQCRILADAYRGSEADGNPRDHEDIRGPMPDMVCRAIDFVDRNTRHPMKVVGLNRVRLDEYPVEALREAVVNALAHRNYEDGGRRIMLEVFSDRIVISSPGNPPSPITLAKLRRGNYKPCSRNPLIAQCLSYFHRIEERGSGFRRMRDAMLDHGLNQPKLGTNTGYFQVTFQGPEDNLDRLRMPVTAVRQIVTPSIGDRLNDRQRGIIRHVMEEGDVARRWCVERFGIANDTAGRDLKELVELGLLARIGQGRSTRYVISGDDEEE